MQLLLKNRNLIMTIEVPPTDFQDQGSYEMLANTLPRVGETRTLTPTAAAMFMMHVSTSGSDIASEITKLIAPLTEHSAANLEAITDNPNAFVVTSDQLRGIVAKAVRLASAQTAYALARATAEVKQLDTLRHKT
jgi:hypothetical protein